MTWIQIAGAVLGLVAVLLSLLAFRRERARAETAEAEMRAVATALPRELPAARDQLASSIFAGPVPDAPELPHPAPPPQLVEALATGECALFAGPGLAAHAGVPSTVAAVRAFLADEVPFHEPPLADMSDETFMEMLRSQLDDDELRTFVAHAVGETTWIRHRIFPALAELPFQGLLTSDVSGAVARLAAPPGAPRVTPWDTQAEFDALLRYRVPFVLETHGNVGVPDSLLFDAHDLQAAIDRNRDYERFLVSLLSTRSLLFVGCSHVQIDEFLREAGASTLTRERTHWALLPWSPDVEVAGRSLKRRYGVEVLVHGRDPSAPEAIERFVAQLQREHARTHALRGAAHAAAEPEELTRLELENIGAFDQLALDLGARRSILLGDNGSGKSTILRAIALVLIGDVRERDGLAQRLLRSGAKFGRIELTIGPHRYHAELRSERGRVRVESPAFTPVQGGLMLALGFPPLRGMSLRDPQGPDTARTGSGPDASDLTPLLSPEPDQRLDSLKQWIVNADARVRSLSGEASVRQQQMLTTFFRIVRDLTPGTDFAFEGVDPSTWRVRLRSAEDGELAFEQLSQGMIAVLGWVGVLLQRLYEAHGEATDPSHAPALVLLDEIDAHLHPEWQRSILPLLDEHFPRLQLVATTHSPLVVTSTRADDAIVRLERDRSGRLGARRIEQPFRGRTPDEVLVSSAFDLETPLDRETDALRHEYAELLARGETPARNRRATELAELLGEPRVARTPQEEEASAHLRAWLRERLDASSPEEREQMVGEAQRYLDRLRAGS